ncbi:MAG: dephospho-CoA kinase [Chloroflexota bacterium]|jgi:dephospho-CoA kinase
MSGSRPRGSQVRRTVRIGLTGPIGCGKSTIGSWLGELGAVVVDADVVARDVTAPGRPAHDAILERFGDAVRAADGTVDRRALARIVFADPTALASLEAIVHPAVRMPILDAVSEAELAAAPAVVLEAIKLVEGGLAAECDEVWLVTCGRDAQVRRLASRGVATDDAERRIAAQAGLVERLRPHATTVLDTDGAEGAARARVRDAYRAALAAHG